MAGACAQFRHSSFSSQEEPGASAPCSLGSRDAGECDCDHDTERVHNKLDNGIHGESSHLLAGKVVREHSFIRAMACASAIPHTHTRARAHTHTHAHTRTRTHHAHSLTHLYLTNGSDNLHDIVKKCDDSVVVSAHVLFHSMESCLRLCLHGSKCCNKGREPLPTHLHRGLGTTSISSQADSF